MFSILFFFFETFFCCLVFDERLNEKKWNAHCRDDLVVMVVVEKREKERERGFRSVSVSVCVSFFFSSGSLVLPPVGAI
jgi:hypothetical protein